MSTYLELVQDLHREVGAAGTEPSAVTSLTGEANRLARWIRRADLLVQNLWTRWKFLYATYSASTSASVATLAAPSGLSTWDLDTFTIAGEQVEAVEYEQIKDEELDTSEAQPSRIIIMPDNSLKLEPVPNAVYAVTADYYKEPTQLSAATDVSAIPAQFHDVILGRAMMLYANHENAEEIKTQGEEIYGEFLPRLESHQLPNQDNARFKGNGAFIEVIAE